MVNNDQKTNISELKELVQKFRDERNWEQYHNAKDLAEAIVIEAGELLEHFLWKDVSVIIKKFEEDPKFKEEVGDELADVLIYCLQMANTTGLDMATIIKDKMAKNAIKYPVDKAKDNAKKYNEL